MHPQLLKTGIKVLYTLSIKGKENIAGLINRDLTDME
jgi:hypothetical protein